MTRPSAAPASIGRYFGGSWPQDAVIAVSIFLLAYVLLPAFLLRYTQARPLVHLLQFVALLGSFGFAALSIFKLLEGPPPPPEAADAGPSTRGVGFDDPTVMVLPQTSARRLEGARPAPTYAVEHPRPSGPAVPDRLPAGGEWTLELIEHLEWKRFEDLCAAYYREKGLRFDFTPLAKEGGLNLRLYQDDSGRPTSIVQCKGDGQPVDVDLVCELLGAMTQENIPKGFFMTPGAYTEDARAIAQQNGITLLDGKLVLAMLKHLPHDARARLLAFAAGGDYSTPTCPACSVKMTWQERPEGGQWVCVNAPRCEVTLPKRTLVSH